MGRRREVGVTVPLPATIGGSLRPSQKYVTQTSVLHEFAVLRTFNVFSCILVEIN